MAIDLKTDPGQRRHIATDRSDATADRFGDPLTDRRQALLLQHRQSAFELTPLGHRAQPVPAPDLAEVKLDRVLNLTEMGVIDGASIDLGREDRERLDIGGGGRIACEPVEALASPGRPKMRRRNQTEPVRRRRSCGPWVRE